MIHTIDEALRNWVRWCLDLSDCGPANYPGEWPMGKVMLPYKVMIDEDEALDEIERSREPDRIWAERVETWVQQLEPWGKIAVQTHYIHWPDSMRSAWNLSADDMKARRARRYARITNTPFSTDGYERAVGTAVAELRERFQLFVRGV